MEITELQQLIQQGNTLLIRQREVHKQKDIMQAKVEEMSKALKADMDLLDKYVRASILVANTADENTKATLDRITGVINKTLGVLFTEDTMTVSIQPTTYRNSYPHYNVVMTTQSGRVRTFKQSGTGLGQVISFLFTLCLIDARGGRKILVMDELLNGLHPDAKVIVRDLMLALNSRFQFICVEYGLDVGKQYIVDKTGDTAQVEEYERGNYYKAIAKKQKDSGDGEEVEEIFTNLDDSALNMTVAEFLQSRIAQ